MKKYTLFLLFGLMFITACEKNPPTEPAVVYSETAQMNEGYVGGNYEGNYIWSGAMNLAWTDLSESIIGEPMVVKINEAKIMTKDDERMAAKVLEITQAFNDSIFSKQDLDEESYYIKAGYGQKTVDQINKESRKKFSEKSFADLDLTLNPTDIIAYAYFLKKVEYVEPFQTKELKFKGEEVSGFEADETRNVEVVNYWNDDHFLIQLPLKDSADEFILAKGFSMENPKEVLESLKEYDDRKTESLRWEDSFKAPMLSFDYHRDYSEMIGKFLANKGFENYKIAKMYENIKFQMDEVGAKVENEAVIEVEYTMSDAPDLDAPPPRNFILDEPFWVIMKRKDSKVPYFILGVKNTKFMELLQDN